MTFVMCSMHLMAGHHLQGAVVQGALCHLNNGLSALDTLAMLSPG